MRSPPSFDAMKDAPSRSQWAAMKTLAKYLWPPDRVDLRSRVVIALISLGIAKGISVTVPFLLKRAVDALSVPQIAIAIPLGLTLAYGAARVLAQCFGELRDFVFSKVSYHAQRVVALETFQHLHDLPLAFHLSRQTGGLSRVIERGTKGIQFALGFLLFNIAPTILEVILVTAILLFRFSFAYAAVIFTTIVLYVVWSFSITDWRLKFRKTMNEKDSEANTKAIDSLLNYETVKYFGNETHEHKRFDKAMAAYEEAAFQSGKALSILNIGQGTIIGAGLVVLMGMAAKGVSKGQMTIGDFVLVNTFLLQLYLPLNFLGFVYREVKQSLIDMDKMFELLDVKADVQDRPQASELKIASGAIEFDHVTFSYSEDRTILKDVSFTVPSGKTVAIVGPSGAGKSTISRLLFRFYDVTAGAIRIDGQDIRDVTQLSLRAAIGVVPQDTVLFNDTIGYNIEYGKPKSERTAVVEAAKLARIHDFVESLPQGYDTMVGERGLKLSGGERQRVSIARTILKAPRILLFDEATSALDTHTEKAIQASLEEVSADRTTLVIAHRLSTIVSADEVLVLKSGEIVERGKHADLLRRGGEYAAMWAKQQAAREYQEKLNEVADSPPSTARTVSA